MKKMLWMTLVLLFSIFVPTMASATHISRWTPVATCDGWDAAVTLSWAWTTSTAGLKYEAVLLDESINTVASFSDSLSLSADGSWIYSNSFGEPWPLDLETCGVYTAKVQFSVYPGEVDRVETEEYEIVLDCPCEQNECHFTPGYWKNHPENWPVDSLTLGDVAYSQAELLDILETPVRGDVTIILAYHLIAAKLNVLNGADPSINAAVADGDSYLIVHHLDSRPLRSDRVEGLEVKDILAAYNEMGCDGSGVEGPDKDFIEDEPATWDSVKSMYR